MKLLCCTMDAKCTASKTTFRIMLKNWGTPRLRTEASNGTLAFLTLYFRVADTRYTPSLIRDTFTSGFKPFPNRQEDEAEEDDDNHSPLEEIIEIEQGGLRL
eukprot:Blabericola_migrator_1__115@NODE_1029_length_5656_cov_134_262122_g709_i0_p5_GENE_NODE_1029_length_5656_cov_134_262122_g709_i0NODE_1029_length_5656_cov_134_262122_g709_i0_p5_ORF_typecomplete_len102_score10_10_NODE_1029_length_5656_cov_134_262122_g709_i040854390